MLKYIVCIWLAHVQATADVQKQYLAGIQYLFEQGQLLVILSELSDSDS